MTGSRLISYASTFVTQLDPRLQECLTSLIGREAGFLFFGICFIEQKSACFLTFLKPQHHPLTSSDIHVVGLNFLLSFSMFFISIFAKRNSVKRGKLLASFSANPTAFNTCHWLPASSTLIANPAPIHSTYQQRGRRGSPL